VAIVGRCGVGAVAGDARYPHSWPIMGIGVGLAMAGHNEASINGDNKVSSKTSK